MVPGGRHRYRLMQERKRYRCCTDIHDLPAIFHYWSDRYIRPMLEEAGASNPDEFFVRYLRLSAERCGERKPIFVSIGAGNCDTEVRVARLLCEAGLECFTIQCLDINPAMLERGRVHAQAEGMEAHIEPLLGDFNSWQPARRYAGILANQALHHVVALESLFDAVRAALLPGASFVVSDMIGRNGHMRWPEALAAVQRFWRELPDSYRYNRALQRHESSYKNWDCSKEGFEGIRAQDILPLLIQRFHFEVFVAFGNVIDVFVDRNFGHNFDAEAQWDRALIDRIHAYDEAELAAGRLTPTHLLAVLGNEPAPQPFHSRGLEPSACVHPSTAMRGDFVPAS